jgi:Fe-S-cluster containining protein
MLCDADLNEIRRQRWQDHPDYRRTKILVRHGLFGKRYRLAQRADGYCVFRTGDRRCRIQQEFGYSAKPLVCRLAPLELVPWDRSAYLTLHRYCPSAAAGRGRPLDEQVEVVRELVSETQLAPRAASPPAVTPRQRLSWRDTLAVADAVERLMLDRNFPLVRRIVHGLKFCDLVAQCRLSRLETERLRELSAMLATSAVEESGDMFRQRTAPDRRAGLLFRQTALEYLRLHPQFVPENSWTERWRMIAAAIAFARGTGEVPRFRLPFPPATFQSLERPLGVPGEAVVKPLEDFMETAVASLRYATLGHPGWSLVESFQSLALSCAVALWLLRLACPDRPPGADDAVRTVVTIDRGLQYPPLLGRRHRLRVRGLAWNDALARLIVWYAP